MLRKMKGSWENSDWGYGSLRSWNWRRQQTKRIKKSTLNDEIKNSNSAKKQERKCNANKTHNKWDMEEDSGSDIMDSEKKQGTIDDIRKESKSICSNYRWWL